MGFRKKGLSNIIAVVLMLLLVLVGVGILWSMIKGNVEEVSREIDYSQELSVVRFSFVLGSVSITSNQDVSFYVERLSGGKGLPGIYVVLEDEYGGSRATEIYVTPGFNIFDRGFVSFSKGEHGLSGNITRILVYPAVIGQDGKLKIYNTPSAVYIVPKSYDYVVLDSDGDGIGDGSDNCPLISNSNQDDGDGDSIGDVCDNCPLISNTGQEDFDNDGIGDVCDNCPYNSNSNQDDGDGDSIGNVCESASFRKCGAGVLGAYECFCEDTIVKNWTMVVNLRNRTGGNICNSDGLLLGMNQDGNRSPVLDCNGFEIAGNNIGTGIHNHNTNETKMIKNCKVHHFSNGVYYSGGSNGFTMQDSEVYNNKKGVSTAGGADILILRSDIHSNSEWGVLLDETLRFEVRESNVHNNYNGISYGFQLILNDIDFHEDLKVINSSIKDNNEIGLKYRTSFGEVKNNIISGNKIGFEFSFARPQIKSNSSYGVRRTNNHIITGNQIFGNSEQDFRVVWDDPTIIGSPGNFNNVFTNNLVNGKEIVYKYDINGQTFSNLDVHSFICMNCKNILLKDSSIREMYFGFSSNSNVDNIVSDGGYYSIYKVNSDNINFNNINIQNNVNVIYERNSINNDFTNINNDCSAVGDSDGDQNCNDVDNCVYNSNFLQEDRDFDGVGDICDNCPYVSNLNQIDADSNNIGDACQLVCYYDVNENGIVLSDDLSLINNRVGSSGCGIVNLPGDSKPWCDLTDVNRDTFVNNVDTGLFTGNNNKICNCTYTIELCDGMDNNCNGQVDEGLSCP